MHQHPMNAIQGDAQRACGRCAGLSTRPPGIYQWSVAAGGGSVTGGIEVACGGRDDRFPAA